MAECVHCHRGNLRDAGYPSDFECVNGIAIDIDEAHEGWQPDVVYPPAPCHPAYCPTCRGSGEQELGDCPDCTAGYRGEIDCKDRLEAWAAASREPEGGSNA